MLYSLKHSQIESGLGLHLMEDPKLFVQWIIPTWFMPLRQFLCLHNITITLTDCWHVHLCCEHGQYLKEPALSDHSFTSSDYEHISHCPPLTLSVMILRSLLCTQVVNNITFYAAEAVAI